MMLIRDLQEGRRRQQLVRRSPKSRQHHLRGDERIRLQGGGTPCDCFLQPQRAVVGRSRQQRGNVMREQVSQPQKRRRAGIDRELLAEPLRQVPGQAEVAADVACDLRMARCDALSDVAQGLHDSLINRPVGNEVEDGTVSK